MEGKSQKANSDRSKPTPNAAARDKSNGTNRVTAMSHPLRARIFRLLAERDVMSPAQLSRALDADLRNVSHHVRRLEKLDCVELVSTRPVRGALEHFYRATERPLITTDEFEKLDPIVAEDLVLNTFQKMLDDFVESRKAEMVGFDRGFHLSRNPIVVDKEGLREAMELLEGSRLGLSEIERRSAERRDSSDAAGIPVCGLLGCFKVPVAALDH